MIFFKNMISFCFYPTYLKFSNPTKKNQVSNKPYKNHTRISSPLWLVTFKIWKRVLPTMTNKNTPSKIGPTLLSCYFFYIKYKLLVFAMSCQCSGCSVFHSWVSFIGRLAFSLKLYFKFMKYYVLYTIT